MRALKPKWSLVLVAAAIAAYAAGSFALAANNKSQNTAHKIAVVEALRPDLNTTRYRAATTSGQDSTWDAPLDGGDDSTVTNLATMDPAGGLSTIASIDTVIVAGYSGVALPMSFSSSGATVVCTIVRYVPTPGAATWTLQSTENTTITAGTVWTDGGTLYMGTRPATFDTNSCVLVKFLFADPSAGTVTPGRATVQ